MTETVLLAGDYRPSAIHPGMSLQAPGAEGVFRLSLTVEGFSTEKPNNGHAVLMILDERGWKDGLFFYVAFRRRTRGIKATARCRLPDGETVNDATIPTPKGLPARIEMTVRVSPTDGISVDFDSGPGAVALDYIPLGLRPVEPRGQVSCYLAGIGQHEPLNSGMVFHRLAHEALAEEPEPEPEPVDGTQVDPAEWTARIDKALYRFAAVSHRWLKTGAVTPHLGAFLAGWLARGVFCDEPEHGEKDAFRDSWRAGWHEADVAREIDLRERKQ